VNIYENDIVIVLDSTGMYQGSQSRRMDAAA
jgi:hypothetical protein